MSLLGQFVLLVALAGPQTSGPVVRLPKTSVLVFCLRDCPIAAKFIPEINRQAKAFGKKVSYRVVLEEPSTPAELQRFRREFKLTTEVVLDPAHALARQFGVKTSPEAVLLVGKSVRYQGRIDDRFPTLGSQRTPRSHDLEAAIKAVLGNKPVAVPRTPAVGCRLP